MYRFCVIAIVLVLLTSCKKTVQQAEEAAVTQAITSGQWKVTQYLKGSNDATADFAAYAFQFQNNSTVDAYKNGTLEKSGTWEANAASRTITSNFTNSTYPLTLLNGVWTITDNTWTSVAANQTVNGELKVLKLSKQ